MLHKGLVGEIKKEYKLLLTVVTLSVTGGLLAIGQAWYMSAIIHAVFLEDSTLEGVAFWLVVLAVLMVLRAVFLMLGERTAHRLADRIKQDVRKRLARHLLTLGPILTARQQSGDLVNALTEGVENLEAYFARYLPQLVSAALIPLIILSFVLTNDISSALLMLVTAPLIPFFMILIGRAAEQLNKRQWDKLSRLSAHFLDVLQGLTTLKLFGRSKEQMAVIARMSGEFRDTTMSVLRVAFLSALTLELFATISTALVAVTVGLKLLYGQLSFVNAFFILLLAPEYYLPLRLLGTHFHAGMAGAAAADQIYRLLTLPLPERQAGTQSVSAAEGISITFDNVHYAYEEGTRQALSGTSFTLKAGQRIALVGPSGAGKSTIASLLLRFINPQEGRILVNGLDITCLDTANWLAHVAYVPQNPHLFYGTVAENIALGFSCSPCEIEEAAVQAGIHEFICRLPQGYDTLVGEGGRSLSGGQRQRIAIARALLRKAPFVILDEATANLDPHTEAAVSEAMERLLTGRTTLIIAHRISTVYKADRILVLQDGRITETGSHEELIRQQGAYTKLAAAFRGMDGGSL